MHTAYSRRAHSWHHHCGRDRRHARYGSAPHRL